MSISQKVFEKSPSRCISSCQQDIKLDQFSQQNTHCRTAILQNSSLGAPIKFNIILPVSFWQDDPNWWSCSAFYIVPKKIQGWTEVYSNTCSNSPISWAGSWLVDHNDFYATNKTADSLSRSYLYHNLL